MIIPPIRWGDISLRSDVKRAVSITEQEQYTLMMLLSLAQMNSELFISDYTIPDSEDIHQFLDECMNSLFNETIPPPVNTMLQIDLFSMNATPLAGIGVLTYNLNTNYPFGYNVTTQDIALYGMTQPVWLKAGEYNYTGWHSKTTLCGNTSVAITDAGGIVDTIIAAFNQNGLANVRFQVTGAFTIPDDGLYNMVVGNVSPVSGNEQCSWISHHIRQTS